MSDPAVNRTARQELVQPSFWDRLVDDLPGMVAETDSLKTELQKEVGPDIDLDQLLEGGPRAVERHTELTADTRQKLHALVIKTINRSKLEDRGIVVDSDVLREAVRRDLEMLFNIERLEADFILTDLEASRIQTTAQELADFPEVRSSVINFGVPSFSGRKGSDFNKDELERDLRHVLHIFEPRLKRNTVKVKVSIGEKTGLRIDIDGVLLLSPVPERLRLSTAINLDNGQASTTIEDA